MKKAYLLLLFFICLIFVNSCGSGIGGQESLTLKYPGTEKQEMPVKSGGFYASTKTWSKPGQNSKSSSYFICVSNLDIDLSRGAISIGASVNDEKQTKVCFNLDGAENTDNNTPLKTETYPAAKSSESFAFNSVSSASIRNFKDGKELKHFFNNSKMSGEVKINSSTENSISGEINLTDGEKEIKGTFSAKSYEKNN